MYPTTRAATMRRAVSPLELELESSALTGGEPWTTAPANTTPSSPRLRKPSIRSYHGVILSVCRHRRVSDLCGGLEVASR